LRQYSFPIKIGSQGVNREKLRKGFSYQKGAHKMLMKLTPEVGLSATVPQKCDGVRRLPPMSEPIPKIEPPWARRQASPPDEPPC